MQLPNGIPETWVGSWSSDMQRLVYMQVRSGVDGPEIINYDVSADGQRFLMIEELADAQPVVRVIQGFTDRLRQSQ